MHTPRDELSLLTLGAETTPNCIKALSERYLHNRTLTPESMSKRSRAWCITENNPPEGRKEWLIDNLERLPNVVYSIFSLEHQDGEGTPHLQGYIRFKHAVTMSSVKTRLLSKRIHLEVRRGTEFEAASYCWKECEPFVEVGTRPTEDGSEKDSSVWDVILRMLELGSTPRDIMLEYPAAYARYSSGIEKMRMELISNSINTWRDVNVTYLWGSTGVGKTRSVLESLDDPSDVYRVTDYRHPFDNYRGQATIIFEEYRSSISIEKMLIYLDGYICELPCRYANKIANWSEVYVITNIHPNDQYRNVQENHPETFAAWERRINHIIHLDKPQFS